MMKFYFAGSIRGGREKLETYMHINNLLKEYGTILDEHVASPNVFELEKNNTDKDIYIRDINWIKKCDILIAEVSVASLGVGYEIAYAESLNKPVICLYDNKIHLSGMISGNDNLILIKYIDEKDMLDKLNKILMELNK